MPETVLPLTGSLDLDTSLDVVKKGNYIASLNTTSVSKDKNQSVMRSCVPGNKLFPLGDYELPSGHNMVIGGICDGVKNRIIDFLYNDNGGCQVREWDFNNMKVNVIVDDKADNIEGAPILDFDKDHKITSINILHRSQDEGDLLFWTDGHKPPREINIDKCKAKQWNYDNISSEDISQIKRPPLTPPTGGYGNDTSRNSNNLRNKLFQFAYRYIYDDYAPSTYSPWSKVFLPVGSTDPNMDTIQTNNNVINLHLTGANNLVIEIEVIARMGVGEKSWSDPVLVETINVRDNPQPDYPIKFYNDGSYPPVNVTEVAQLYSYLPDLSDCQMLINGNVLIHGAITEGYNYSDVKPDVEMSAGLENGYNSSASSNPLPVNEGDFSVTYTFDGDSTINYTVTYNGSTALSGAATVVVHSHFVWHSGFLGGKNPHDDTLNFQLTEGQSSVTKSVNYSHNVVSSSIRVSIQSASGYRQNIAENTFFSIPKYDWWAHYQWGLIYYDKNGKTNSVYTGKDMSLFMPHYNEFQNGYGGNIIQTPYVNASIKHKPPKWAVSYQWVRSKNLSESFALYWKAINVFSDEKYVYLDISNLIYNYTEINPSTNYRYDFAKGDKVRLIWYDNIPTSSPLSYEDKEYAVLGMPTNPKAGNGDYITGFKITNPGFGYTSAPTVQITGGGGSGATAHAIVYNGQVTEIVVDKQGNGYTSAPTVTLTGGGGSDASAVAISGYFNGTFIKLYKDKDEYPDGNVLIKLYRPQQVTNEEDTIFYEFGEKYNIITDALGNRYHSGMLQDQGANQPATFKFTEGDFFFTTIYVPKSVTETPTSYFQIYAMSMNYNDYYPSGQNSNGRAVGVFTNAKRLKYPTMVRFSGAYLQNTRTNKMSLYLDSDQDEYNRSYGAIRRFSFRRNFLRVFQERKVGNVPVLSAIIQTAAGNDVLSQSDRLINRIQYDIADFGIGDAPASLASENFADYFVDTNRGVQCRVSHNGVEPISILYSTNSLFANRLIQYNENLLKSASPNPSTPNAARPTIYGVFDTFRNEYVVSMEAIERWKNGVKITDIPAESMGFNESKNGYEGNYSYAPEFVLCLNNLLCTFKNGALYTHDDEEHPCNFFGVQYDAYVTIVLNENLVNDKGYLSLKETASGIWHSDEIKTSLGQVSKLPEKKFEILEGNPAASFMNDKQSPGGLIDGTPLKGKYLTARLRITPKKPENITAVTIKYNIYP